MRDLQRAKHATDFFQIIFCVIKITRITAAKLHAIFFEHPPRRAAHFPFGASIRAGAEDDPQTFLLRDAAKFRVIRLAAPDEFARLRFVHAPEQISADRIQPHRLGHLQPVTPIFLGHARRVDFAAADLEALAVEQKVIRADGESMFGAGSRLRVGAAREQHGRSKKRK